MNLTQPVAQIHIAPFTRGNIFLHEKVTLNWEQGQQWCVTGLTGAGKSTLLKLLAGQIFSPHAIIDYPLITDLKSINSSKPYNSDWISFVPQEVSIPSIYIEDLYYQRRFQAAEQENIPAVIDILQRTANGDLTSIERVIDWMQLRPNLHQPFVQLSNGQTRRLMIAISLLKQPAILLLDHPYAGLDIQARNELNQTLTTLALTGIHILMAALEHEIAPTSFITNVLRLNIKPGELNSKPLPESFQPPLFASSDIIELKHCSVEYGSKSIIKHLDWKVNKGDRWVIKGRNGSGKSTLLSIITADHPQSYSNELYLFGQLRGSGESIWDIKKRIGYFSPELLRYFEGQKSVLECIASGFSDTIININTVSDGDVIFKTRQLAVWLGIDHWLDRKFQELSFGEQRIVLIARAMVRNPELLILDEPLQGLDTHWRECLKRKLHEFCLERTLLYVTHDEEEIPQGEWNILELTA